MPDMVLIEGDPSKKIEEMEKVETVFKNGVGYDARMRVESVRGQVGIRSRDGLLRYGTSKCQWFWHGSGLVRGSQGRTHARYNEMT